MDTKADADVDTSTKHSWSLYAFVAVLVLLSGYFLISNPKELGKTYQHKYSVIALDTSEYCTGKPVKCSLFVNIKAHAYNPELKTTFVFKDSTANLRKYKKGQNIQLEEFIPYNEFVWNFYQIGGFITIMMIFCIVIGVFVFLFTRYCFPK